MRLGLALALVVHALLALLGVTAVQAAPLLPRVPQSAQLAPRSDGFLARVGARVQHWRTGPLHVVGEHEAIDVAWRPDGAAFALLDAAGAVKIVEVARPTVERVVATPQPRAHAIAGFVPDGKRLLLATRDWQSDRNVLVDLDVTTGQAKTRLVFRREPALAVPSPVRLDPRGHWLAIQRLDTTPRALQVWNLDTDEGMDLACQHGSQLAWSHDGAQLAADCGPSLKLFATADRFATPKIYLMPETGEPRFSARGDRLWRVASAGGRATVVKTASPHETPDFAEGLLDWGGGDRQLVVKQQRLELVDAGSGRRLEAAGTVVPLQMTRLAGGLVEVSSPATEMVALLDPARGAVIETRSAKVARPSVVVLPDGKTLLGLQGERPQVALPAGIDAARVVALSPDGRWLIAALVEGTVVHDLKTQARTRLPLADVVTASWSPDSSAVYAASLSGAIVWRVAKPDAPIKVPLSHEQEAAWSSRGLLAVSDAGTLWWWQNDKSGSAKIPRLRRPVTPAAKPGAPQTAHALRFAADGARLDVLSCGNRDFDEAQGFRLDARGGGPRALGPVKRGACAPPPEDGDPKLRVTLDGGALHFARGTDGRAIDVYGVSGVDERGAGTLALWLFAGSERLAP